MKVKKQNKVISIIDGEMLNFVEIDPTGAHKKVASVKLEDLLGHNGDANLIPVTMRDRVNTLLIVPDYWFGNSVYKFQSGRKSLAEAFVERKLKAQFEQLADIKYFFDITFFQRERHEQWLYAYFLQDPQFYQVYQALSELDLTPQRITSPAFMWGPRLQEEIADFDKGGKCFIQQLPGVYHLYFFFKGNFLFSRSISLSDIEGNASDNLQTITFELNQSLYLFSQRAKSEVDTLYLLACGSDSTVELSEALGREIIELTAILDGSQAWCSSDGSSEPQGYLPVTHWQSQTKYLFLSHRKLRKELEWKSVQSVGMVIGLLLFLVLGLETIFLFKFSDQYQTSPVNEAGIVVGEVNQQIRQYNQALDVLLEEAARLLPQDVLVKIAESLPYDVQLQEIVLETASNPSVNFKGIVIAQGPDHLKGSLSALIVAMNKNLQPAKALAMPDIDLEPDRSTQNYLIKFKLEL